MSANGHFPGNKKFAFSVFDDTDSSTVESIRPVYELLADLNVRITKSVWVLPTDARLRFSGATLQDREYLKFVLGLKKRDFEIGLHNVQNGDATRDRIEKGVEEFHDLLGEYPRSHANHFSNRDNVYWGPERLTRTAPRWAYNVATRFQYNGYYRGHDSHSKFFWGDICKEKITYVRNFVFDEINLLRVNPTLPYHNPAKPYVNFWFSSCEGGDAERYCRLLSDENQDRLEAEHGVCIMYTHFAAGFCDRGIVHPEFRRLMMRLASKDGWFVPVSTLLDHLRQRRSDSCIPEAELTGMERSWLAHKLRTGPS